MKKGLLLLLILPFFLSNSCAQSQAPGNRPHCSEADFDRKVSQMLSFSVPTIGVQELRDIQDEVHIFDTRNQEEYDVSHIPNALYLGYQDYNPNRLKDIPKNAKIVLYCSIGYRSEKIGEKLLAQGFTNVFNLYGSIFEWVNQGYPVENKDGRSTPKVHTYNKQWSKWLNGEKAEKVW